MSNFTFKCFCVRKNFFPAAGIDIIDAALDTAGNNFVTVLLEFTAVYGNELASKKIKFFHAGP